MILSPCESAGEELNAGDDDPGFGAGDGCLEVLCKTAIASEPSKSAFDHPSSGLRLEGPDALGSGDDFNRPLAQIGERIEQFWSSIDAIGEDVAQFGEPSSDGSQQRHSAVIVLDIGRLHQDCEQRAFGIGDDVALAALDLLGHVKPTRAAAFRGLRALAVDDAG